MPGRAHRLLEWHYVAAERRDGLISKTVQNHPHRVMPGHAQVRDAPGPSRSEVREMASMEVPADRPTLATPAKVVVAKPTYIPFLTLAFMTTARRPAVVDRQILLGEALILETYCPDKLKPFEDEIDAPQTDDMLKK
jgi:hypothetical protein